MSNPPEPEHHITAATGVRTEKKPDAVRYGLGISSREVTTVPARREGDMSRVFERAEKVARKELRTLGELACGQLTSFAWTLEGTIAEDDAIAVSLSAPRDMVMSAVERARQVARNELHASSSLTVAQLSYFLGALEAEDDAGTDGDAAAAATEPTRLATLDRLMPGLKVAKQLACDELRAASRRMFAPFTSIPAVLNGQDGAGAAGGDTVERADTSPEPQPSPQYDKAHSWPARPHVVIDGPSPVGRVAPTYQSPGRRRLSSAGPLTPSPSPGAGAERKRERYEDDDAAAWAPAAKHHRVETDTAAGSSRASSTRGASPTEPTHASVAIYTTVASAAVAKCCDSEDGYDEPNTPPTRPMCGRRPTPRPPQRMLPAPRTFTVEYEAGRNKGEVKQEPEDDGQPIFARSPIHRETSKVPMTRMESMEPPELAPQSRGKQMKAGRSTKGRRQGKKAKRDRSDQ